MIFIVLYLTITSVIFIRYFYLFMARETRKEAAKILSECYDYNVDETELNNLID